MKETAVVVLQDKKECFASSFESTDYTDYTLVALKNKKRALKKFYKKIQHTKVLVGSKYVNEAIFENNLNVCSEYSCDVALTIINTLCRKVAEKYSLKTPLENIYIFAKYDVAYKIIEELVDISRLFSVFSDISVQKEADRLYFKYGCMIRHPQKKDIKNEKDCIIIYAWDEDYRFENISPIINLGKAFVDGENVINANKVSVSDDKISEVAEGLSCVSGLELYAALGILPGENAKVNINKTADTIFMLDTKQN